VSDAGAQRRLGHNLGDGNHWEGTESGVEERVTPMKVVPRRRISEKRVCFLKGKTFHQATPCRPSSRRDLLLKVPSKKPLTKKKFSGEGETIVLEKS